MKSRFYISLVFVLAGISVLAQPRITSVTYDGNQAILTRNTPPAGIIYYWQGASCGTLMNHFGSTTVATNDGTYYLRAYHSSSSSWESSCASTVVAFPDLTPPVLYNVTPGPLEEGDPISATSNEDGMLYLVPDGTTASYSSIVANRVASAVATATVAASLSTSGIGMGDFVVYAADEAHNISAESAVITITDLTPPVLSDVTAGPVEVGTDIMATSNEDGMLYLVPDGTAPNVGDITSAQVASAAVTGGVAGTLSTTGIEPGDYVVYAVDGSDNISAASPAITVNTASYIDLSNANPNQVQLYPVQVIDILHIKSKVPLASVRVYTLTGKKVIDITTATDQVDMSRLHAGIYIVNITMQDSVVYNGKVSKQ